MNKMMITSSLLTALLFVVLAGATLIGEPGHMAGLAKPFIDLHSLGSWSVGLVLLIGAIAISFVAVFFAWRDRQQTMA